MIPQLLMIVLGVLGLGMSIAKHGEEEKGKKNGWASFWGLLIVWTILYYGGFWDAMKLN